MEELKELMESLDLDEFDYYYHITGKGYGEEIFENGLYMEENDLKTTTVKVPKEMIEDPYEYCSNEYRDGIIKRKEMILIGCDKGEGDNIIQEADIPMYINDEELNYLIRSENIICSIDLETLDITYNPEYIGFGYFRR